jgi:benzoyl-CoA reductase/2-hydroxyglutaryl-CoA dehydratase subunit BcrC/BadD/HgdB
MNRILCSSPHIPRQWIAAHGLEPVHLLPSGGCEHACVARAEGLCVFARAWISEALAEPAAAGIVLAQTCDQMRRTFEVLQSQTDLPSFLFNIPATWQSVPARRLFAGEMKRLGQFLENLGGSKPSAARLQEQMRIGTGRNITRSGRIKKYRIPLALTGAHGMTNGESWRSLLEQAGGEIALDCTQAADPLFDHRVAKDEPFAQLVHGCFDAIQDIFQRPNSGVYQRLNAEIRQVSVKGLIIRRYLWCDLWHAEVYRLKQWSPVPVLDLEISGRPDEDHHRLRTRIESFLEMVF